MKKVLITGGNGFLGANLVRMLCPQNYEIKLLVREGADLKALEGLKVNIVLGNITEEKDVFNAVRESHYVIHAASITGQSGIAFEQYEAVNVTATQHIVQACLQYKIEKLIYVSTANAIGPGSFGDPGTELNGFSYFKANSGYINTKYLAQQFVLEAVPRNNLPAVVVNPTFMIGAYGSRPGSGRIILYGLNRKILFYPPGGKNFVHVEDVCQGIINAIAIGKPGECYLLAGENLTYKQFFKELNKVSPLQQFMIRIPPFILKLSARLCSLISMVNHKPQQLNPSSAYLLCCHNYYTGKKSERELNIRYQPVSKAIAQAYNWFKENKQ